VHLRYVAFLDPDNRLNPVRWRRGWHSLDGHQVALPTWTEAQAGDWLGRWAMNLTLINGSTRELRRAVRLPRGRSAGERRMATRSRRRRARFVALTAERLAAWMASDLSKLDLLVIQIDGLHVGTELVGRGPRH
jgi:putative transposase